MLYLLLFINLITFTTFALDKWKAVKHKRRISELSLYIMTFLGGTLGAILGILIFRHKISKKSFLLKIGLIILLQILIIIFIKLKIKN
ncbi:DUF1294 domain-containing protein [Chryseobacterium sp.]|uniref:DUF1294 domain-containing protein n=1 Tax=Chryseobacterium sp. TaxID=1871047 RepID=UPI0026128399|nr:DUF1294 domain-containing protein [Chryseobacterium sp.]